MTTVQKARLPVRLCVAALALVALPWLGSADSLLSDEKDEFTDERRLMVIVTPEEKGDLFSGTRSFGFYCLRGRTTTGISPGILIHFGDSVEVKMRFGEEPMKVPQTFQWSGEAAFKMNDGPLLLRRALRVDSLLVKVEDADTMTFDLKSARVDLREFQRRCEAWKQSENGQ